MAKRTKQQPHQTIKAFSENPARVLNSLSGDNPFIITLDGKTQFKIVPAGLIPKEINWLRSQHSVTPISGGSNQPQGVKVTFHPSTITKILKNIKPEVAAKVEFVEQAQDTPTKNLDNAEEDVAVTQPIIDEPIKEEAVSSEDVMSVIPASIESTRFEKIDWSQFLHSNNPKNKPISAYDHVTRDNGVGVIYYAGRQKPIGFMLPFHSTNGNDITTNSRWQSSKFASSIKGRWAKTPMMEDMVVVSNQRKSASMVYVTMGAAVALMDKSDIFKNAPEWVQDVLIEAAIEKEKGANVTKAKAPSVSVADKPAAAKPTAATTTKPTPVVEPVAAKPAAKSVEPPKVPEPSTSIVDNNLAALRQAIATAKMTNDLIEAENGVVVGANNNSITAMEEVISFAKDMGVTAPEIKVIPFTATSMTSMMSAFKEAKDMAEQSEALVILEPTKGERVAMTRNNDLITAYRMG